MKCGVFVTATDTGVGKTIVSACLVRAWHARYWKPVQTGLDEDPGDTGTVVALAEIDAARCHPPRYALRAALSPEAAARREGVSLALEDFALPDGEGPMVVEGAGGVLVPLTSQALMIDLMARLGLPVVLVARTALGTINHTLLSLQVLRARGLTVRGVVLVGAPNAENAADIAHHGRVEIIGLLPWVGRVGCAEVAAWAGLMPRK